MAIKVTYNEMNGIPNSDTFLGFSYHIKDGWIFITDYTGNPIASVREDDVKRIDKEDS